MRNKRSTVLLIPPVMLCTMLIVVMLITACLGDEDPDVTAPALTDAPTAIPDGTELTPPIDPCGTGVPASAVDVGVRQTVRGDVVNTRVVEDELGEVTLLEMGEEGGDLPFAIAIPEDAISDFASPPEELYAGTEVCVNGVVQDFQGTPVIFVATDSEIVTTEQ